MDIKSLDKASDIIYEIGSIREELNNIKEYKFVVSDKRFASNKKYNEIANRISFKILKPYIDGLKKKLNDLQKEFDEL